MDVSSGSTGKLLTVLTEKTIDVVGSTESAKVDGVNSTCRDNTEYLLGMQVLPSTSKVVVELHEQ